jgi:hypothetical protein
VSRTCGSHLYLASDRGALARLRRLRGVEPPVALFDAASPLVPANDAADIRASALACSSDFPLCLADCQGKDLTLRLDELRLLPAALAVAVRERPETADLAAAVGVLAEAVFLVCAPLL